MFQRFGGIFRELAQRERLQPISGLKSWVEKRVQLGESLGAAVALEELHRGREGVEKRSQAAVSEAKAYADQGLAVMGSAIEALGKLLNELASKYDRLSAEQAALLAKIQIYEAERVEMAGNAPASPLQLRPAATAYSSLLKTDDRTAGIKNFAFAAVVQRLEDLADRQLREAGGRLRLMFGRDRSLLSGFVNVDLTSSSSLELADQTAALPLSAASLLEIRADCVLDRISHSLIDGVLNHWRDLLASGGRITTSCRDGDALRSYLRDQSVSLETIHASLPSPDVETVVSMSNLLTPSQLRAALEEIGFMEVEFTRDRPNFSFCLSALKAG